MDENKQFFRIPMIGRNEAYSFEATNESFKLYEELNAINEEIENVA